MNTLMEDQDYCAICTPLGIDWPGKLGLSSDCDEQDDWAKDKDQKQPDASPNIFIMPNQTLKPLKPYITKFFDSMSSKYTPIIYTPKEKQSCDITIVQQEHNSTECKNLDQHSLDEIDKKGN